MEKDYRKLSQEELLIKIRELEKEVKKLNHQIIKDDRYGLNWIDCPEAFEEETENKIPILEEVKDKAISNDDGKPTHILIEGDNYHALTCLNYTHKGKIDVIYIDPPYNTGSDGFTYKDKRFLKEYPNGQPVPKEHPLRHSYWLSFMSKRLQLAKELLSACGVIFISIDNNEFAQLKILCDKIFDENNFVETFLWNKTSTPPALSYKSRKTHEYILCYQNKLNNDRFVGLTNEDGDAPLLNEGNNEITLNFPANYVKTNLSNGIYKAGQRDRVNLINDIEVKNGIIITKFSLCARFRWKQETLNKEIKNGCKLIVKSNKFAIRYCRIGNRSVAPPNLITERFYNSDSIIDKSNNEVDTNEKAGEEVFNILGSKLFDYPKPTSLISYLISFNDRSDITILDFFAGSGTTLHATMNLNEKDNGNRQCILVQQNEKNICEEVCYERNKRVIQGYTNSKGEEIEGLGNSLKYYKTSFVGKHSPNKVTDDDRVELSYKAGYLLALSENTLEEIKKTDYYQIFENNDNATAIYFKEDLRGFDDFVKEVEKLEKPTSVYIFSWDNAQGFEYNFEQIKQVQIKSIPQAILEIYKSINQ